MYAFTLERPASLADAAKLAAGGGKVLAGDPRLVARRQSPGDKLALGAPGANAGS